MVNVEVNHKAGIRSGCDSSSSDAAARCWAQLVGESREAHNSAVLTHLEFCSASRSFGTSTSGRDSTHHLANFSFLPKSNFRPSTHCRHKPESQQQIPHPPKRLPLTVRLLVSRSCTWSTELLRFAPPVVRHQQCPVVLHQCLFQLVLCILVHIFLVVCDLQCGSQNSCNAHWFAPKTPYMKPGGGYVRLTWQSLVGWRKLGMCDHRRKREPGCRHLLIVNNDRQHKTSVRRFPADSVTRCQLYVPNLSGPRMRIGWIDH